MRTLLTGITVIVVTAILAPAVTVAKFLGLRDGPRSFYQWAMHGWARSLNWAAGVELRLHGAERIDATRGIVYVANHVSWFDVFAMAAVLPRYSFIAKSELRRIPVFAQGAEAAGIVFIDRDNRKAAFASYKVAARQVELGRSIVVCPEGTRGFDYPLRPFKKGPFVLAIAAQAPIVPTLIHGTREVMRKGSFRVRSGVVNIHFLEPVETVGHGYEDRTEIMEIVWQRMSDAMRELYGVHTDEHPIARRSERSA